MKRSEAWHWIVTLVLVGMVIVSWHRTGNLRERLEEDELDVSDVTTQLLATRAQVRDLGAEIAAVKEAQPPTRDAWGQGSVAEEVKPEPPKQVELAGPTAWLMLPAERAVDGDVLVYRDGAMRWEKPKTVEIPWSKVTLDCVDPGITPANVPAVSYSDCVYRGDTVIPDGTVTVWSRRKCVGPVH